MGPGVEGGHGGVKGSLQKRGLDSGSYLTNRKIIRARYIRGRI